jgi:hypothetical protein
MQKNIKSKKKGREMVNIDTNIEIVKKTVVICIFYKKNNLNISKNV